jgi:hypothetical protein
VKVDAAVLHALVEGGEVKVSVSNRVGQKDRIVRAAGGACGRPDLQRSGPVCFRLIDGLTWHRLNAQAYLTPAIGSRYLVTMSANA